MRTEEILVSMQRLRMLKWRQLVARLVNFAGSGPLLLAAALSL
jgi:hypothetical protein